MRVDSGRTALEAADRPAPPFLRGDWSAASGYEQGRRIAADPDATVVSSANDEMAAGLCRAFHEAGVRVPDDISAVGFDDIPLAEFL